MMELTLKQLLKDQQCSEQEEVLYRWLLSFGGNPIYEGGINWFWVNSASLKITSDELEAKLNEIGFRSRGSKRNKTGLHFAYGV